jgi:drug/metabolite transporter (DMT)-like permease
MADTMVPARPSEPGTHLASSYALVLLAVGCFVVNAGVSRLVLTSGVAPAELASIRAVGTTVVLLAVVLVTGRARALAIRRGEVLPLLAYGVVGTALLHMTYFAAIERLPIGIALLLEYLAPVLVALWVRVVRREPVRATLWPALGLCLVGLALVAQIGGTGPGLDPWGLAAGLAAAVCFAAYFLLGERIVRARDPLTTTFWGFAIASIVWTAVSPAWVPLARVAGEQTSLPEVLGGGDVPVAALLVWGVLLGTVVPFAATTAALRHLPAATVSVVAILEPVGAALLAWWWFEESLDLLQLVGVTLVLLGILLALRARRPMEAPLPAVTPLPAPPPT